MLPPILNPTYTVVSCFVLAFHDSLLSSQVMYFLHSAHTLQMVLITARFPNPSTSFVCNCAYSFEAAWLPHSSICNNFKYFPIFFTGASDTQTLCILRCLSTSLTSRYCFVVSGVCQSTGASFLVSGVFFRSFSQVLVSGASDRHDACF